MAPTKTEPSNADEAQLRQTPCYHLVSDRGWVNDPNGPLYFNGRYHLFYQNVPENVEWSWGLVWGHAVSDDLIHWERLPPALRPSPDGYDEDGCFSGCAAVDENGTPTLLYTGVRLRRGAPHVAGLTAIGVSKLCQEAQVAAVAEDIHADDGKLLRWRKAEKPLLEAPPKGVEVNCFRDPFILERPNPSNGNEWVAIVGSGLPGIGGTALLYRSPSLLNGWRYDGNVCGAGGVHSGYLWECPSISKLTSRQAPKKPLPAEITGNGLYTPASCDPGVGTSDAPHLLSVSNGLIPSIYWIGNYANGRFDLKSAQGPFNIDLGRQFYAPNVLVDPQGRLLMWGWLMDGDQTGNVLPPTCAGSISACRQVTWDAEGKTLYQEPLPELVELRKPQGSWVGRDIDLLQGEPFILPQVDSAHLDLEIEFELDAPTERCRAGGAGWVTALAVMIRSTTDPAMAPAAALMYHFDSRVLEMLQELPVGPRALGVTDVVLTQAAASKSTSRVGGQLHVPPEALGTTAKPTSHIASGVCAVCGSNTSLVGDGHSIVSSGRATSLTPLTLSHTDGCPALDGASFMGNGHLPANGSNGTPHNGNGTINGCNGATNGSHKVAQSKQEGPVTLTLRLLVDGSIIETFTSTGQVLTSRVYRERRAGVPLSANAPSVGVLQHILHPRTDDEHAHGEPFKNPHGPYGFAPDMEDYKDAGIELIALGTPLRIKRVEAHEMKSMWVDGKGSVMSPPCKAAPTPRN